jgi:hypothetical protein
VGLLVAAGLTVVGANSARSWLKDGERFEPLWVNVRPLAKFYLANGLATAQQLRALDTADNLDESLNEGFRFTIVRWASGPSALVYWDDRKFFTTTVSRAVGYKQLAFKKTRGAVREDDPPQLFIDADSPKGFRLSVRRSGETDSIPVAVVPYAAFRCGQFPHGRVKSERRTALLAEHGWTDESNSEFEWNRISHQQFSVEWGFL